jgi:hypothetical protein
MAANDQFMRATIAAGIHHPRCGLAAFDVVKMLEGEPLPYLTDRDRVSLGGRLPMWRRQLGPVISAGLARLDPDVKRYVITPKGRAWLEGIAAAGITAAA